MKQLRILFAAVAAVSVLMFASCSGKSKLQEAVKSINDACPASMGMIGEMTSAEIDGDNVILTMSVDEQYINLEGLKNNPEVHKANMKAVFRTPSDDMKELIEALKEANSGITFVYVGKTSGRKVSVSLTSKEMQSMGNEEDEDPDAALDAQIAIANAQVPVQVDEITTLVQVTREPGVVAYLYEIDEQRASMEQLENAREVMASMLVEALQTQRNEVSSRYFMEICHKTGVDFLYRYRGSTTGQIVEILIPSADIFGN